MLFGKKKRRIGRLLLVEDEPLIAFDTEHLLTEQDYEVVATVDCVTDAVALIVEGADIHLVLVDVRLADGSGIDVARAAQGRAIPVIFVSGDCPVEAEMFGTGHLAKPYTQRGLLGAINAVEATLEGKSPRRMPGGFRLFERV